MKLVIFSCLLVLLVIQVHGEITNGELRALSERLMGRDVNNVFQHLQLDLQEQTTPSSNADHAPRRLFSSVASAAWNVSTISSLTQLHDNYIPDKSVPETVSSQERGEENDFLDKVLATSVMQETHSFLVSKGLASGNLQNFKQKLRQIWFDMYPLSGSTVGSSGFEHVFLGEHKGSTKIVGFHSWIYFQREEAANYADYRGYIRKKDFGRGLILSFRFKWHGRRKPRSTVFIGTSPELEMALYTVCFLARPNAACPFMLNGQRFGVQTWSKVYNGESHVATAFPMI